MIPRFYEIASGTIRVNGVDIREASQEEVRSKIGLVPQKAVLFTGTIADNIRFGKEDATHEEIEHAARIAQAEEFISRMEGGYQAQIEQGGIESLRRSETALVHCKSTCSETGYLSI